ncbi:MAG: histidine phosphatase family protein [Prevotellaceae bacterium]|jgi:2,3-bisphosphoglycerate-dependent phosphoglycerate mutase|nr:histidine phosphatase family protein [Prevotellaceae bacterium]
MHRLENIFLMRHAHSAGNGDLAMYRHIPDHAIPLSGKGEVQAIEAGIQFAAFLSQSQSLIGIQEMRLWYSPYLRTKQTRNGLLEGMGNATDVFKDQREHILLAEQNFGLFDGLTNEECDEKYPEESRKYNLCAEYNGRFYAKPPNGESRYDVCVRIHQFFGTIIRDAEKPENAVSNVFIVLHGNTMRAFLMMWLHREVEWFENERNPDNCSIRRIGRNASGRFEDMGYIFQGFRE